jgi:hypothetical protein
MTRSFALRDGGFAAISPSAAPTGFLVITLPFIIGSSSGKPDAKRLNTFFTIRSSAE